MGAPPCRRQFPYFFFSLVPLSALSCFFFGLVSGDIFPHIDLYPGFGGFCFFPLFQKLSRLTGQELDVTS